MKSNKNTPLLEVENLKKHFPLGTGIFNRQLSSLKAVDGISFTVNEGETLGLVGESGCGKSTAGRTIIRLYKPTEGTIAFMGQNIAKAEQKTLGDLRRNMQMIFQDPFSSLNRRMTVENIVGEAMSVHKLVKNRTERKEKVREILEKVGLVDDQLKRYPHEFSGGQRQRIGIARALSVSPKMIIADEPVSALDVSIQAQVINLMLDLQHSMGLTYLFISHDLSVIRHISDRVAVMYLGRIVELAEKRELFTHPLHPYTQALLSAIPIPDTRRERKRIVLDGEVPSPLNPPSGCPFHTRCPQAMNQCKGDVPVYRSIATDHAVACHLYNN